MFSVTVHFVYHLQKMTPLIHFCQIPSWAGVGHCHTNYNGIIIKGITVLFNRKQDYQSIAATHSDVSDEPKVNTESSFLIL